MRKVMICCVALALAGCNQGSTTQVDPAESAVKSVVREKRPSETETTKLSVTTASEDPVHVIIRVVPCDTLPASSPSSSASAPSPEPNN